MPSQYTPARTRKGTTLFKHTPTAPFWYYRTQYAGQNEVFNLGNDLKKAKKLADEIANFLVFNSIEAAREKFYPGDRLASPNLPTFAEIIRWFRNARRLTGLSERTVENYVQALTNVAHLYAPKGANKKETELLKVRSLNKPVTCLNRAAWDLLVTEATLKNGLTRATRNSLNARLRNLKALFAPRHIHYYPNWDPSWVKDFMTIQPYTNTMVKYRLPPENLIIDTITRIELMEPGPVRNMLTLALRAGMRRSEICYARADWVEHHDNICRIHIGESWEFKPKGATGFTEIDPFFLERCESPQSEYLVGVDDISVRVDDVPKSSLALLRSWGWQDYANPLHELRKIFGSVVASTRGLFAAQALLRHSNSQVTSDNYADLILGDSILKAWDAGIGRNRSNHQHSSVVQRLP